MWWEAVWASTGVYQPKNEKIAISAISKKDIMRTLYVMICSMQKRTCLLGQYLSQRSSQATCIICTVVLFSMQLTLAGNCLPCTQMTYNLHNQERSAKT